jgi:hypothetical protein
MPDETDVELVGVGDQRSQLAAMEFDVSGEAGDDLDRLAGVEPQTGPPLGVSLPLLPHDVDVAAKFGLLQAHSGRPGVLSMVGHLTIVAPGTLGTGGGLARARFRAGACARPS